MKDYWYKDGLYFKCTSCGKCCTGAPGFVWLSQKEILKISNFLKISKNSFLKKYTIKVKNLISLKEKKPSYDCIFLENKKCKIYKIRPLQCKTYPFWPQNLTSKKAWKENILKNCPGALEKSKLYSKEEIKKISLKQIKYFLEIT
ncbi:MAG: hypothetical protein AMS24_02465 [Chlamydiae bacterium SM23_39]|nr:MAG: hypothetical protein AMS24_02465 [Chlamydiae bacterium SM23_39]